MSETDKKGKNKVGRPKIPEARVRKLEQSFKNGLNVSEACFVSGVPRRTYYSKLKADESFRTKMEYAQAYIAIQAKQNIAIRIVNEKNIDDSWRYLERRDKDFKPAGVNVNVKQTVETMDDEQWEGALKRIEEGQKARQRYREMKKVSDS